MKYVTLIYYPSIFSKVKIIINLLIVLRNKVRVHIVMSMTAIRLGKIDETNSVLS